MSVRIASNKPVVLLILKICILLSVYIIYKILIVNSEATMSLLNPLFNSYMELVRSITNFLLGKIGSAAQITEHNMVADNLRVIAIGHQFMIKKWLYLLISAVILTPSTPRLRTIFSFILALVYTVSVSLLMAIYAHLISHFTHTQAKDMASAFSIICLVAWLYFWIRLNRKYIAQRLPGMNAGTIYRKLNEIILAIFLFVIIRYLIVGYFDFLYWITFLFTASQKILAWFGYSLKSPLTVLAASPTLIQARPPLFSTRKTSSQTRSSSLCINSKAESPSFLFKASLIDGFCRLNVSSHMAIMG